MPVFTAHEPGMLCWADLGVDDLGPLKTFYARLFGWTIEDEAGQGPEPYLHARLAAGSVAALYRRRRGEAPAGAAAAWNTYLSVRDVDSLAARVAGLGGTLHTGPFDVHDAGRMAIVADPTGGTVCLWQPRKSIGADVMNEPGSLAWCELLTNDTAAATRFYSDLLDWQAEPMPGMAYTVFKAGGKNSCGMMALPKGLEGARPHWIVSFAVADCDATVASATALGGRVHKPPSDIPGVGRFAVLADPAAAPFTVVTTKAGTFFT